MSVLIEQLKDWQTAIAATVGFGGLIVAALVNAHLNRRRDTRLRDNEANSVAAALYGEILLLRREVSDIARIVANLEAAQREVDADFITSHPFSEPTIYRELAAKLGMLPVATVLGITRFHRDFWEARVSLPLLVNDPKRGFSYSAGSFLRPAFDAVEKVKPTLRQLEDKLQITAHVEDCDLGLTDAIIENEELQHEESRSN